MYGYIRPDRGELKVREYQQFRAAYCGLCEALRRRCGLLARFVVNYDLTFLAMALSEGEGRLEERRCPAHPLRKRPCVCGDEALGVAADYSVILAWWKLQDAVEDSAFFRGLSARMAQLLLRRSYRRAAARRPGFDGEVRRRLEQLAELEAEKCPVLDRAADCFAEILAFAAQETPDENRRRIQRQLFYHVGRMVYILDAVDDLAEDVRARRFNPLIYRFTPVGGTLREEDEAQLHITLNLSQRSAAASLALLDTGVWKPILENIVTIGIPEVTELVFSGQWRKNRKRAKAPAILFQGENI